MTAQTHLSQTFTWEGPGIDENDEQFGDVVEWVPLDGADAHEVVLAGEPYDGAVIGRAGAREGPRAIREALAGVKTHHFQRGPVEAVGDLGTLSIPTDASVATVQEHVRSVAREIHAVDALPVFLGGDNSLTFPNVVSLFDTAPERRIGAVNVDAHLDCRAVDGQPTSGTPYRQLLDTGLDALAVVGARQFETSTVYADFLDTVGGEVLTASTAGADPRAAAERSRAALGDVDGVYVSVDMDVLDVTAAPGVSAPTPGGLTSRELFSLVESLVADDRLVGLEVVETAPPLCSDGRTARTAARLLAHAISAVGGGRGERR